MMLFTFFLFGLVFVAKSASGGENPSCQVQTEKDKIIDLKQTQKLNKKAKLLRGLNSSSSSECQEECCGNSQCTLFVYHHRKESRHSCFLVSCSPESKCVYQQLEGSLVGHVSRPRPLAKGLVLSANDLTVSQPTVASASNSSVQSSSPSSTIKISSQTTAGILSTTVRGSTPTELHSTSVTLNLVTSSVGENATAISDHNEKSPKKLDEHTTAASLVIALCFGILFLFAVVILIGRPWWDAFQRPRYSKVDYLMNGL